MSLNFQYNKIALKELERAIKLRYAALPTIRSKESALRFEIKKQSEILNTKMHALQKAILKTEAFSGMWSEWPQNIIRIKKVHTRKEKFAGVAYPVLLDIEFTIESYALAMQSLWIAEGMQIMKTLATQQIETDILKQKIQILTAERKRTTQKLNLYEKVQIPEFEEAKRKIKRYLEDEDNLAKASQKLLKNKLEKEQQ